MKVPTRSLFRLLWPHIRPYRGALVLVLCLGTFSAMAQQSAVLLVKPIWEVLFSQESAPAADLVPVVEEGLLARAKDAISDVVLGKDPQLDDPEVRRALLLRVSLLIAGIAVLGALTGYAFYVIASWTALRMVISLRMALARHLLGLSLRYHGQRKLGDLISRTSADVDRAMAVVNIFLRELVQHPLKAAISLGAAAVLAPKVTLLVVIGLPLMILPVAALLRRVRKKSTQSLADLGASVHALAQMFRGIRTVKAFRAEERELVRYQGANDRFATTAMKMARAGALSGTWTLLYTHVGLAVILLTLGWMMLRPGTQYESSDLAPFFLLISQAYSSIKTTTRAWGNVAEASGACERLQELLDERPDIVERESARRCASLGSGLALENVSFAYPGGEGQALRAVDLEVRPGETLALVGPSGAGKSTLIDLVARFIDPTEGRITVDGVDLRDLSLDSWSARFAMVTQEPFLFHASVEENLRYGKPDATQQQVEQAARAANIHDFIVTMPLGYDTDVDDAGSRLSGGQRQRMTIARAILHGGELLLLDEATSALDTESESVVQAALEKLMVDRTVIVIAHRLSTVRNADRIAVLDRGELVEVGTHEQLMGNGGLYARLYEMQFRE